MPLCPLVSPFTGSAFAANCSSLSHTLPPVLEAMLLVVWQISKRTKMAQGAALFRAESRRAFCLSDRWRICSCRSQGLLSYTDIYISALKKKNSSSLSLCSVLQLCVCRYARDSVLLFVLKCESAVEQNSNVCFL